MTPIPLLNPPGISEMEGARTPWPQQPPPWHMPHTFRVCAQEQPGYQVLRLRLGTPQVPCGSLDTRLPLGADTAVKNGDLATHSGGRTAQRGVK